MLMMTAQDFAYFVLGYATGGLTLILIKLVIQLHEANLLFKSKEAEGLNQEEVRGLDRVKEIMRMAHKLKWVYPPNKTSYPSMQLSEVEKCMLAMYNDFDLNRLRKWVEETQSSEQDKEAEG